MKKKIELTLDEQRKIQLEILIEVDVCCRKYNIRYSLAFGSLIGAIRHKGYIPWDDDLDIMMPYEDMLKLREKLHSNMLTFHDVDTDSTYGNAFANICSNKTCRENGKGRERGIGIDVYPIIKLPSSKEQEELFFKKLAKLQTKRAFMRRMRNTMFRYFAIKRIPGYTCIIKRYRNYLVSYNDGNSNRYYIIAGPISRRDALTYDVNLFSKLTDVEFEGNLYRSIADYDFFLRKTYGDYMQLPPEEQRHPYHGQHYYWK